jgi:hypothetical protein
MMNGDFDCRNFVQEYIEYLSQDFIVNEYLDNGCHIITPFWRSDGNHIELFIITNKDGNTLLTDEGQTLDWLFSVGLEVNGSKNREDLVSQLAIRYGVELKNGVFSQLLNPESVGLDIHRFLTALKAISYITLLRKPYGKPTFKDEVELYLIETQQEYKPNYLITGKTVEHRIPFYLNSNRNWLVETLSANTLGSAKPALYKVTFEWIDIAASGQNYRKVTLVDDTNNQWEEVWSNRKVRLPLEEYSDQVIRWSQRTQLLRPLDM